MKNPIHVILAVGWLAVLYALLWAFVPYVAAYVTAAVLTILSACILEDYLE